MVYGSNNEIGLLICLRRIARLKYNPCRVSAAKLSASNVLAAAAASIAVQIEPLNKRKAIASAARKLRFRRSFSKDPDFL